jgi:hypothetical protein
VDQESVVNLESRDNGLMPVRKRWTTPRISDLARLTELTLQTGSPIVGGGGTGNGGSSVF